MQDTVVICLGYYHLFIYIIWHGDYNWAIQNVPQTNNTECEQNKKKLQPL